MRPRIFQLRQYVLLAALQLSLTGSQSLAQSTGMGSSSQDPFPGSALTPSNNANLPPLPVAERERSVVELPANQQLRPALPDSRWTAEQSSPQHNTSSGQSVSTGGRIAEATPQVVPASATGQPLAVPPSGSTSHRTPLNPPTKANEETKAKSGNTLQMLMSVGSSLLIVIGLFLGFAWFYRKSVGSGLAGSLPKNVVQVLGKTTVASRQQLVLLRFGSKLVLVSMVQGDARTISEITDPLEVDQLAGLCESQQPGSISNSFRDILAQGVSS